MSGLPDYLRELATRQQILHDTISVLGDALSRLDEVEQLDELLQRVQLQQGGIVVDYKAPLLLRPARTWAVVGPGGIPDDVKLVGESVSLFGDPREVVQPDLKGYCESGRLVLTGAKFLELAAELREQVQAGRLTLPYYPKTGMVMTDEERSERSTE